MLEDIKRRLKPLANTQHINIAEVFSRMKEDISKLDQRGMVKFEEEISLR